MGSAFKNKVCCCNFRPVPESFHLFFVSFANGFKRPISSGLIMKMVAKTCVPKDFETALEFIVTDFA
jgi:hypothetical protein